MNTLFHPDIGSVSFVDIWHTTIAFQHIKHDDETAVTAFNQPQLSHGRHCPFDYLHA